MRYLTKSLMLFFVLIALSSYAQNKAAIYLNQQNGLPSNYVYDIFQDKKGFVWMATDVGLYRYDGFEYKLYASENQSSLAGSCIQEDKYGRIWYENFDGYLFYIENGKINQIDQKSPIQFLPFGLSDKYLYVIYKNGVNVYDLKTLRLHKTINVEFVYAENAALIDGNFFITDQDKVINIDPNFNVYQTGVQIDREMGIKLIKPLDGKIAVISRNTKTINFYDKKLNFIRQETPTLKGLFHDVNFLGANVYWFITSKGIEYAKINGAKFEIFGSAWSDLSAAKYMVDNTGNEWLATLGAGVILQPKIINQEVYSSDKKYSHIYKKGAAFIGLTDKGNVELLNQQFNVDKTLFSNGNHISYMYMPTTISSFLYTDNKGLHLYDLDLVRDNDVALKEAVKLDEKYYLVAVSGFYGLFKNPIAPLGFRSNWDKYFTQNVFNFENFSAFKSHIRAKTIDYNFETKQIIVGTNVGTFVNEQGVEQEIKYKDTSFFVSKIFWCANTLFALSTNGSVYKITNLNQFEKIDVGEDVIKQMKRQGEEVFLIGENLVYAYHLKEKILSKYDIDFNNNTISDFLVDGDFLILVGDSGITKIKYKNIKSMGVKMPFYINNLYVNEKKVTSLEDLSFSQNNIRINYSVLNYGKKNGSIVYYRLNKGAWVLANENERNVHLPSLASGSYVVEFKLNDEVLKQSVKIDIAVPVWKSWWFYLLVSLGVLAAVSFYFSTKTRLYTQQIKFLNEKIRLEKSLGKSVLTSIKAQMNPHFFYNALNTIQGFVFTNDKVSANNYLAKFSKLTRLVLEMSEKESVALSEEIDAIKMYLDLEKMRFGSKFDYALILKNIDSVEHIELPPMLIQPLIENAVKHGLLHLDKLGKLDISFVKGDDCLLVEVEDNGIGRKRSGELKANKDKTHNSFAIKANRARIDILNKNRTGNLFELEIVDKQENGIATGTIAKLTIPLD